MHLCSQKPKPCPRRLTELGQQHLPQTSIWLIPSPVFSGMLCFLHHHQLCELTFSSMQCFSMCWSCFFIRISKLQPRRYRAWSPGSLYSLLRRVPPGIFLLQKSWTFADDQDRKLSCLLQLNSGLGQLFPLHMRKCALFSRPRCPSLKCMVTQTKHCFHLGKDASTFLLRAATWVPSVTQADPGFNTAWTNRLLNSSNPIPNNSPSASVRLMGRPYFMDYLFDVHQMKRKMCRGFVVVFRSKIVLLCQ